MYNKIWGSMEECKICENPKDCANCEYKALIENLPKDDDDDDWENRNLIVVSYAIDGH